MSIDSLNPRLRTAVLSRPSNTALLRTLLLGAVLLVLSVIGLSTSSASASTLEELVSSAHAAGPADHRVAQMGAERTWTPRGSLVTESEIDPPERVEPGETDELFRLRAASALLALRTKHPATVVEWPPSVVLATRLELARAARGPPHRS